MTQFFVVQWDDGTQTKVERVRGYRKALMAAMRLTGKKRAVHVDRTHEGAWIHKRWTLKK